MINETAFEMVCKIKLEDLSENKKHLVYEKAELVGLLDKGRSEPLNPIEKNRCEELIQTFESEGFIKTPYSKEADIHKKFCDQEVYLGKIEDWLSKFNAERVESGFKGVDSKTIKKISRLGELLGKAIKPFPS